MVRSVEDLVVKDPRLLTQELATLLNRFNNLKQNNITLKELTLQMDNARPHSAALTNDYLGNTGVTMLSQSPYSPDLNLCDRFLFTRLQQHCRGWNMQTGTSCTGT